MKESIGGMMIRKMIEAAEKNMREEKTEMKNTTTEPKTYNCTVSLSTEYVITANTAEEARDKAAMKFMAEATDGTPHELSPIINVRYADEVNETEEDDLDWDCEEDEINYQLFYEDNAGYNSNYFNTIDDILCDIADRYRLSADEMNDLDNKLDELIAGDLGCDYLDYELPFIELYIWRVEAD